MADLSTICSGLGDPKLLQMIDGCFTATDREKTLAQLCCMKDLTYPIDGARLITEYIAPRYVEVNATIPTVYTVYDNELSRIPYQRKQQVRGVIFCLTHDAPDTISDEQLNVFLRFTNKAGAQFTIPVFNFFALLNNPVTEDFDLLSNKLEVINDNDYCVNLNALLLLSAPTGAVGIGCPYSAPSTPNEIFPSAVQLKTPVATTTTVTPTQITLVWGMVFNAVLYSIEYSDNGVDNWINVANTTLLTYTDILPSNTIRFYRVTAIGDQVNYTNSMTSLIVNATTLLPQLATPVILSVTPNISSVQLFWGDVANEYGYLVEYSTDNSTWNQLTNTLPDANSFTHTGLPQGALYYYRVTAIADNIHYTTSLPSLVSSTTTLIKLSYPSGISATATSDTAIDLSWSVVANAQAYDLYQSTDDITYTLITTLGEAVSFLQITALTPATTYYFKFVTVGNGTTYANSDMSAMVTATTQN